MDYHNQRTWLKHRHRRNRIRKHANRHRNRPMTDGRRATHRNRQGKAGGGLLRRFIGWVLNQGRAGSSD